MGFRRRNTDGIVNRNTIYIRSFIFPWVSKRVSNISNIINNSLLQLQLSLALSRSRIIQCISCWQEACKLAIYHGGPWCITYLSKINVVFELYCVYHLVLCLLLMAQLLWHVTIKKCIAFSFCSYLLSFMFPSSTLFYQVILFLLPFQTHTIHILHKADRSKNI